MRMSRKFLFPIFYSASLLISTCVARADDGLMKDFDSLGGNDVLLEKAQTVNGDAQVSTRVVQDRAVVRRARIEISPSYENVLGGDAYNKTQELGLNVQYHINPHWSVGAKYGYAMNSLRPEGQNLLDGKTAGGATLIPDIDYPKSEMLALLDWYPIYGKMNLYDLGIVHFDLYTILGAGLVELKSGTKPSYTAGGGLGIWWSKHLTTRLELRYQTYRATHYTGDSDMNLTVAGLQIGYLL
jgi:outer membrane immunogenic protein